MREVNRVSRRLFGLGLVVITALTPFGRRGFAQEDAPVDVTIRKFTFEPMSLVIRRGQRVRWTNKDIAPHTATSEDNAWDTGTLEKDDALSASFPEVGVFRYYCVYHPHMRGQITVVEE